jgi:uncharacterized protein
MDHATDFLTDDDLVEPLAETQCRDLLRTRTYGRVGLTSGGLPVILPVRYICDGEAITFRTGHGTKLRAAANGDVLAFQVDSYDLDAGTGWSVLALGRATVLTIHREDDGLPTVDATQAQPRNHYVRLGCEMITGRLISPVGASGQ